MGCCQTYLVTIARIACCRLARDDALRQLTFEGFVYTFIYIARARYAHSLIDISTARQWVTNSSTQTGRSTSERLNLGRVVVGLVLKLQEPLLCLALDIYIDEDRASVVLLANLHIVEFSDLAEIACANRCKLHQAQRLLLTAEFLAHQAELCQCRLELLLHKRLVNLYLLDLGSEGGVTAVVAPIGIQNSQLGLCRVTMLRAEVLHNTTQVVGIHSQAVRLAVWLQILLLHIGKALQYRHRLNISLLGV